MKENRERKELRLRKERGKDGEKEEKKHKIDPLTEQHVLRLHVPVHQPGRVDGRDPLGDVPGQAHDPCPGAKKAVAVVAASSVAVVQARKRGGGRAPRTERREDQEVRRQGPRPDERGDPVAVLSTRSRHRWHCRHAGQRRDLGAERGAVGGPPQRDALDGDGDFFVLARFLPSSSLFFGLLLQRQNRRSDRRVRPLREHPDALYRGLGDCEGRVGGVAYGGGLFFFVWGGFGVQGSSSSSGG